MLPFDMPYQTNTLTADQVATYLQSVVSSVSRRGAIVSFQANKSATLMAFALAGISTRWTLSEGQTAMSGDWFINGRRGKIGLGGRFEMEIYVVPAGGQSAWVLGTSALTTSATLAI